VLWRAGRGVGASLKKKRKGGSAAVRSEAAVAQLRSWGLVTGPEVNGAGAGELEHPGPWQGLGPHGPGEGPSPRHGQGNPGGVESL
jgi:hypothetical protein